MRRIRYVNEAKGPHLLSVIGSGNTNRSSKVVVGVYKPGWFKLRPYDSVFKSGAEAFGEVVDDVFEEVKKFAKNIKSQGPTNAVSIEALLQTATAAISEFVPTEILAAGMSRSGKSTMFCAVLNKNSETFRVERPAEEVLEFELNSEATASPVDNGPLVAFRESVKANDKYRSIRDSILRRHDLDAFASARFRGPLVSISEDKASSSIILPIQRGDFFSATLRLLSREAIEDMREAVAKAVEGLQSESDDKEEEEEEEEQEVQAELRQTGDYERIVQLFDLDKTCTMIEADPKAIRAAKLCPLFEPFVGQTGIVYRPSYNNYETGAEKIHDFQLQFVTEDWSLYPLVKNDEPLLTVPSNNLPWNVRIVDTPGSKEDFSGRQHLLPQYALAKKPVGCIVALGSSFANEAREAIIQGELLQRFIKGDVSMAFVKAIDLSYTNETGELLLSKASAATEDLKDKALELFKYAAQENAQLRKQLPPKERQAVLNRIDYIPVCSARENLFGIGELQAFIRKVHEGCVKEHNVTIAGHVDALLKTAIIDVAKLPIPDEDVRWVQQMFTRILTRMDGFRRASETKWKNRQDTLFTEISNKLNHAIRTDRAVFERRQALLHVERNNYHRLLQVLNEAKTTPKRTAREPDEADPRSDSTFVSLLVGDMAASGAQPVATAIAGCVLDIISMEPDDIIDDCGAFRDAKAKKSTLLHLLLWKVKERLRSALHDKLQQALALNEESLRAAILIAAVTPCAEFASGFTPKHMKTLAKVGSITSTAIDHIKSKKWVEIQRKTRDNVDALLRNEIHNTFLVAHKAMMDTLERELADIASTTGSVNIKKEKLAASKDGVADPVFDSLVALLRKFQTECVKNDVKDYEEENTRNVFLTTYRQVTGKEWIPSDLPALEPSLADSAEEDLDAYLENFDAKVESIPTDTLMRILSKYQVSRIRSLKKRETIIRYVKEHAVKRYQQSKEEGDEEDDDRKPVSRPAKMQKLR